MDGTDWGPNSTSPDYVEEVKHALRRWRNESPSVVTMAMGYVAQPVGWLLNQIIPSSAIEGALSGVDWLAKQAVRGRLADDLRDLKKCDERADQIITAHALAGAAEGAAAGFFGVLAIPLDIPATIALAVLTIRQVGAEYGYDSDTEQESDFVLSVLQTAGANSQAEKLAALAANAYLRTILVQQAFKGMAAKAAANPIGGEAAILAIRSLAKQLGINITKRKALAALPVIGMLVGASVNGWFVRDVGATAQKLYQERWLRDHGLIGDGEMDDESPDDGLPVA